MKTTIFQSQKHRHRHLPPHIDPVLLERVLPTISVYWQGAEALLKAGQILHTPLAYYATDREKLRKFLGIKEAA